MSLPPELRAEAPRRVFAALPGARAVGGCVRDALAGLPLHDLDMAAPLPPDAVSTRLRDAGFRVFETGLKHGTVTAVLDGVPIEVTSLRRDVATDGRHAEVEWTTDWREDAARRDFTINAMSLDAGGALHDYFGGEADLRGGVVRFVGDAATRLREDYLRALRFFRFQARYGRGEPDAAARDAIRMVGDGLARLSAERVWAELKRLFEAPDPTGALALMEDWGILGKVLPGSRVEPDFLRTLVSEGAPKRPVLWLAALFPGLSADKGKDVSRRLRMSNEEKEAFAVLADLPALPPPGEERPLRRWAALVPRPDAENQAWLAFLDERPGPSGNPARARLAWLARQPQLVFPVQGRDVLEMGVSPGPLVGRLLGDAFEWWVDAGATASREECLRYLRELAGSPPA